MSKRKNTGQKFTEQAKSFGRIITEDIKHGDLTTSWRQDFQEIYHFYLDKATKERLKTMGRAKRWIYIFFWLCKSLFLKLAPARRIMLLLGLVLMTNAVNFEFGVLQVSNLNLMGVVLVLTVLALEQKDKLLAKDELAIGRKVQKALLPTTHPLLDGWELWLYTRPANEVGGDLVDFIPLDSDALGLALGDVAGKGLGAALLMAKLQATLRALAPAHKKLDTLGKAVNHILCRDGLKNRFATLVYLQLQAHSGTVQLLNAGHMPPLLIRNGEIIELNRGGPALGITSKAQYHQEETTINVGDWLLVYSDGLTEARDIQDRFFGDDRLKQTLLKKPWPSVEMLGRALIDAVNTFAGTARPSDDLSLILIRRIQ